jgi:RpiR family transcriptional regulator, carbohydrate utilization regulator
MTETPTESDPFARPSGSPILERISALLPSLRRSDRKVAEAVLDNPREVVHCTMAQLAALAGVSEPTVMRFCNAVGTDGFQSFRLELAQTVALGLPPTHSAIAISDPPELLVSKVFDHTITSLDRARRSLDPVRVLDAINAILNASSVFFMGYGASGIVAQDAQQKFPLFGIPCEAYVDSHQQFIAASMSGPDSVCVAISNTGRTVGILQAVEVALERGCTVIGLSGERGPLLDMASIPLLAATFEDTDVYTPSTSRLAALAVVDILATGVAMRRSNEHLTALRQMKVGLTSMRTGVPPASPSLADDHHG